MLVEAVHKYKKRSLFQRWLKTLAAGSNSSEQNPSYRNAVIESRTESHKARSSGKMKSLILFYQDTQHTLTLLWFYCVYGTQLYNSFICDILQQLGRVKFQH